MNLGRKGFYEQKRLNNLSYESKILTEKSMAVIKKNEILDKINKKGENSEREK